MATKPIPEISDDIFEFYAERYGIPKQDLELAADIYALYSFGLIRQVVDSVGTPRWETACKKLTNTTLESEHSHLGG
jgi:hypothetical protein